MFAPAATDDDDASDDDVDVVAMQQWSVDDLMRKHVFRIILLCQAIRSSNRSQTLLISLATIKAHINGGPVQRFKQTTTSNTIEAMAAKFTSLVDS